MASGINFGALELLLNAPNKKAVEDLVELCFRYRNTEFPPQVVGKLSGAFNSTEDKAKKVRQDRLRDSGISPLSPPSLFWVISVSN